MIFRKLGIHRQCKLNGKKIQCLNNFKGVWLEGKKTLITTSYFMKSSLTALKNNTFKLYQGNDILTGLQCYIVLTFLFFFFLNQPMITAVLKCNCIFCLECFISFDPSHLFKPHTRTQTHHTNPLSFSQDAVLWFIVMVIWSIFIMYCRYYSLWGLLKVSAECVIGFVTHSNTRLVWANRREPERICGSIWFHCSFIPILGMHIFSFLFQDLFLAFLPLFW